MTRYAPGALLILSFLLAGCGPTQPPMEQRRTADFGGTEITLIGMEPDRARQALGAAAEDLQFIARVSDAGRPGPLGRTNQLLTLTGEFSANPSLLPLIRRARTLSERTGGLFNPALGRLNALWGEAEPPAETALQAVLAQTPTMENIIIDGIRMRSTNPAVRLEFGAFAAGYAIDVAMARLGEAGARRAAVRTPHGLSALGEGPDGAWRMRVPLPGGDHAELALRDGEAAYTVAAGPAADPGQGPIDPRTGHPARGFRSVTAVAPSAAEASAYATALFVAGPARSARLASTLGLDKVLTVGANGHLSLSPAMKGRVERRPGRRASPKG